MNTLDEYTHLSAASALEAGDCGLALERIHARGYDGLDAINGLLDAIKDTHNPKAVNAALDMAERLALDLSFYDGEAVSFRVSTIRDEIARGAWAADERTNA